MTPSGIEPATFRLVVIVVIMTKENAGQSGVLIASRGITSILIPGWGHPVCCLVGSGSIPPYVIYMCILLVWGPVGSRALLQRKFGNYSRMN